IVISGKAVIVGGIVSTTLISCVAIPIFPAPSIAVQIIVVVPNGNCAGALLESDLIPLASVASINKPFGGVMSGFVRSPGTGLTGFSVWVCTSEVVFSVEEYV